MGDNVLEIRELSKDYGDFVLDKVKFFTPPWCHYGADWRKWCRKIDND